jgi:hypothetical protein
MELKMTAETWTAVIAGVTFLVLLVGMIWTSGMWLANRFTDMKESVLKVIAEHEREDTRRFERINEILMTDNLRRNPEFPRDRRG